MRTRRGWRNCIILTTTISHNTWYKFFNGFVQLHQLLKLILAKNWSAMFYQYHMYYYYFAVSSTSGGSRVANSALSSIYVAFVSCPGVCITAIRFRNWDCRAPTLLTDRVSRLRYTSFWEAKPLGITMGFQPTTLGKIFHGPKLWQNFTSRKKHRKDKNNISLLLITFNSEGGEVLLLLQISCILCHVLDWDGSHETPL